MQELAWLMEPIRVWMNGGSLGEVVSTPGFLMLAATAALFVPSSLILMGIGGLDEWRKTPLAWRFGVSPEDPDANWAERARDLDKDGTPDF